MGFPYRDEFDIVPGPLIPVDARGSFDLTYGVSYLTGYPGQSLSDVTVLLVDEVGYVLGIGHVPASLWVPPPTPTGGHCRYTLLDGLIRDSWLAHGGGTLEDALGCPLSDEMETPDGKGRYNQFERGQIVYSPSTGTKSLQVIYSMTMNNGGKAIHFEWGPTDPYSYMDWFLRLDINGQNVWQKDRSEIVSNGAAWSTGGTYEIPNADLDNNYSFIVEGCDIGGIFNNEHFCKQSWSSPAWVGAPPAPNNAPSTTWTLSLQAGPGSELPLWSTDGSMQLAMAAVVDSITYVVTPDWAEPSQTIPSSPGTIAKVTLGVPPSGSHAVTVKISGKYHTSEVGVFNRWTCNQALAPVTNGDIASDSKPVVYTRFNESASWILSVSPQFDNAGCLSSYSIAPTWQGVNP